MENANERARRTERAQWHVSPTALSIEDCELCVRELELNDVVLVPWTDVEIGVGFRDRDAWVSVLLFPLDHREVVRVHFPDFLDLADLVESLRSGALDDDLLRRFLGSVEEEGAEPATQRLLAAVVAADSDLLIEFDGDTLRFHLKSCGHDLEVCRRPDRETELVLVPEVKNE